MCALQTAISNAFGGIFAGTNSVVDSLASDPTSFGNYNTLQCNSGYADNGAYTSISLNFSTGNSSSLLHFYSGGITPSGSNSNPVDIEGTPTLPQFDAVFNVPLNNFENDSSVGYALAYIPSYTVSMSSWFTSEISPQIISPYAVQGLTNQIVLVQFYSYTSNGTSTSPQAIGGLTNTFTNSVVLNNGNNFWYYSINDINPPSNYFNYDFAIIITMNSVNISGSSINIISRNLFEGNVPAPNSWTSSGGLNSSNVNFGSANYSNNNSGNYSTPNSFGVTTPTFILGVNSQSARVNTNAIWPTSPSNAIVFASYFTSHMSAGGQNIPQDLGWLGFCGTIQSMNTFVSNLTKTAVDLSNELGYSTEGCFGSISGVSFAFANYGNTLR